MISDNNIRASPADYLSHVPYIFSLSITNNTFYVFGSPCCSRLLKEIGWREESATFEQEGGVFRQSPKIFWY